MSWLSTSVKPACSGPRGLPIDVVPSSRPINRATAAPPDARPGIERDGTGRGLRNACSERVRGRLGAPRWWPRCSTKRSTCAANHWMYRVLASEVRFRNAGRSAPSLRYKKPELMASGAEPGVVLGYHAAARAEEWSYYYLYVIMDSLQLYVVGWMVAVPGELGAGRPVQQSCLKDGVQPRVLTLHSDRGAPMTSQCTVSTSR